MQRIIVDLPEPDGPITTTTSRWPTLRSMSCSAVNEPNRLTTPRSSIIGSPVPPARVASARSVVGVGLVAHLVPTPSLRSSRWLSRLIVMQPTQNTSITKARDSPVRP